MEKGQVNEFDKLQIAFQRYFSIIKDGTSDPTWPDGCNANLCRNHYQYHLNRIKESYPLKNWSCLEWIRHDLMPEVPNDYMARPDEIREAAKQALKLYEKNEHLLYIMNNIARYSEGSKKGMSADNILGYYLRLKTAIDEDDLVAMRRHENPHDYIEAFKDLFEKMKRTPLDRFELDFHCDLA